MDRDLDFSTRISYASMDEWSQTVQPGLKYSCKSQLGETMGGEREYAQEVPITEPTNDRPQCTSTHGDDPVSHPMRDELTNLAFPHCQGSGPGYIIKPGYVEPRYGQQ